MNKGSLSRPLQRRGERTQLVAVELKCEGFTRSEALTKRAIESDDYN